MRILKARGHQRWKVRGRRASAWSRFANGRVRPLDRMEKAVVAMILVVLAFLGGSMLFYEFSSGYPGTPSFAGCPSGWALVPNGPDGHVCRPDPFTTLWDGNVANAAFGKIAGDALSVFGSCAANTACALPLSSPVANQLVVVVLQAFSESTVCNNGAITVTDTQLNTYTQFGTCKGSSAKALDVNIFTATISTTGADTVTAKEVASGFNFDAFQFHGTSAAQLSLLDFIGNTGANMGASHTFTESGLRQFEVVVDEGVGSSTAGGCGVSPSGGFINALTDTGGCQAGGVDGFEAYTLATYQMGFAGGTLTLTDTATGTSPVMAIHLVLGLQGFPLCPPQYQCGPDGLAFYNAGVSAIALAPNATFPGVAETAGRIDLSNGAAKALAFAMDWALQPAATLAAGQRYAWFLTANATLPRQAGYDPLNDTSVVMAVYGFAVNSNTVRYYVYIQREQGQALWQGSADPGVTGTGGSSTCTLGTGGTLFLCASVGVPSNQNSNVADPVLNFTGGQNSASAGQSYGCFGSVNFGTHTCLVGGTHSSSISFQAQVVNQTLFPWLNVQNSYTLGFWSSAGGPAIDMLVNGGGLAAVVSVFTPPASTLNPNQDTGGFFGLLGRGLGSAWNSVSSAVGGGFNAIINPLVNFGSSIVNSLISAMIQAVTALVNAFRTALNAVGQFLHIGNIGDAVASFFTSLATSFVSLVDTVFNFFQFVYSFITSAGSNILSFLAAAAAFLTSVVAFLWTIWGFVISTNFSLSTVLFLDFGWGFFRLYDEGMAGLWEWVKFNRFMFTFLFDTLWWVFDSGTRTYLRIKEMVSGWV